jgi:hypothetical protein
MQPKCLVSKCHNRRGTHGICGRHWSCLPAVVQVKVAEAHRTVKARPHDKGARLLFDDVRENAVRMLEG